MNAMNVSHPVLPIVSRPHCDFPDFLSPHTATVQTPPLNAAQSDMLLHLSKMIARLRDTKV